MVSWGVPSCELCIVTLLIAGLFTAHQDEENWAIAHRILIPAFGPLSIRNMFGGMTDIAQQLIAKVSARRALYALQLTAHLQWHRFEGQKVDVVHDFTKLTLDAIALCTFSHRFNSFYSEDPPAFVGAMARSLKASGLKTRRLPGTGWAYRQTDKQTAADIKLQHDIADQVCSVIMPS
jgi:cytochrome P450/NADPH-cytochrome P450 reductase